LEILAIKWLNRHNYTGTQGLNPHTPTPTHTHQHTIFLLPQSCISLFLHPISHLPFSVPAKALSLSLSLPLSLSLYVTFNLHHWLSFTSTHTQIQNQSPSPYSLLKSYLSLCHDFKDSLSHSNLSNYCLSLNVIREIGWTLPQK